ncbi:hypothetical protein, partial [Paraburkholderia sp. GAS32]|uniref:hypothetical protein n=1 Tax=Paraburkholderia sp. GAS32 TaxID=3035129 RepID=UPI003D19C805
TVKRLHADDSADSRVKVGNRQAPLQDQKPHPEKVGFLRLPGKNRRRKHRRRQTLEALRLFWSHSFPIRSAFAYRVSSR